MMPAQQGSELMRFATALAFLLASSFQALAADSGPVIVIPGRPGVPIILDGIDASYTVVEGDWGFAKGAHVPRTIYGGRPIDPVPHVGHWYPSAGLQPGYGRLEIEPPADRKLPQPAESYHQSWSSQSYPPKAESKAEPEVPFYPPPVIRAPSNGPPGRPENFPGQQPGEVRPR
jgi:hypothetical protein